MKVEQEDGWWGLAQGQMSHDRNRLYRTLNFSQALKDSKFDSLPMKRIYWKYFFLLLYVIQIGEVSIVTLWVRLNNFSKTKIQKKKKSLQKFEI